MLCLSRKRIVVTKDQPHGPGLSVPMFNWSGTLFYVCLRYTLSLNLHRHTPPLTYISIQPIFFTSCCVKLFYLPFPSKRLKSIFSISKQQLASLREFMRTLKRIRPRLAKFSLFSILIDFNDKFKNKKYYY